MDDNKYGNKLIKSVEENNIIDESLFLKYNVKRGLRNSDSSGVLVGLTKISSVIGYEKLDEDVVPVEGKLFYRGIDIKELIEGFQKEKRQGYEEIVFLLLFGRLPSKEELSNIKEHLIMLRDLPTNFNEDVILKFKGKDMMNMLARAVLVLYTLDENADNVSTENLIKQSLSLIAKFPIILVNSYNAMVYGYHKKTLMIRHPRDDLNTAENFLYMLKGDNYTQLEADILDLVLVLHAEHGGGNNSSFSVRVVSSSDTGTYSAIAAGLGSLKGPLHGGANKQVTMMIEDIKKNVKNWKDDDEVAEYLRRILDKKAHDKSGKIYGLGHAVYTKSDPRAVILKEKASQLAKEQGRTDEFELYEAIERLGPRLFQDMKGNKKIISANVDFYSGFVYECLGIPVELYTPLFAMARISGWCAHRIEEMLISKRIIRPAYKSVAELQKYISLDER